MKKFKSYIIKVLTTALILIAAVFLGKFVFMLLEWIFGLFSSLFGAILSFAVKNIWQILVIIILFSVVFCFSDRITDFFNKNVRGKAISKQRVFRAKKTKKDDDEEDDFDQE